jgi:hypothetical protein
MAATVLAPGGRGFLVNKPALWAWLAIVIPITALFGPALVSDRSFAMRDAGHFYYPLFEWCCGEWAAGRVPLWNPYENCGLPVLADTSSSVFYPGKLLLLLPLDFALRYKLYIMLHVVLAAAGSYALARAWKASEMAAAIAAMAYACGGNVVFQYCNVVFLVGAAWLPFAGLAIDRMIRRRSWRAAMVLGVVLALMILGGDPQAAYHGLMIAGLYALLAPRDGDHTANARQICLSMAQWAQLLFVRLGLIGLAAAIGFLLAAVQVVPSAEATKYSERAAFNRPRNIYEVAAVAAMPSNDAQPLGETRGQSITRGLFTLPEEGSHQDLAYDFSVGPWRLAEYVWPNVGGRMMPTNRRWLSLLPAEGRTWTPTLYLGLLPIVLAVASLRFRRASGHERWLTLIAVIFTLASFGYYGLGWLLGELSLAMEGQDAAKPAIAPPVGGAYWLFVTLLPTYVYFRYPAKLLPVVSLGLSQLAAIGFDRAFAERQPRLARGMLVLGAISGACAFIVWCIGPGLFSKVARSDASLGPFDGVGAYQDLLFAFVQAAAVAFASRSLITKAWNEPSKIAQWRTLTLLLTAAELAVANAWLVVMAPADLWRSEPTIAGAIRAEHRADRDSGAVPRRVFRGNLSNWRPPGFRQTASPARPAELAQWEHDTLFPKHHLPSGLSLVESYGSIKLMDYESLLFIAKQYGPVQPDKSSLPQPTSLRLLGTELLVIPEKQQPEFAALQARNAESWPEAANLWRMSRTLPRAWIVHEVETLAPLARPLRIEAVDERTKAVLFPGNKARDFRRVAVVETDAPLAEWRDKADANTTSDTDEPCRITHYDPQHVIIEAEPTRPGLLVLSDAWFPGWKATTSSGEDSKEAVIYRTNRVLRGVWLNAGKQTVEFRFQPASFHRGAAISVVGWFGLAVLGLVLLARRHRHQIE